MTAMIAIEAVPQSPWAPVRMDISGRTLVATQVDDRQLSELPTVAHEAAAVVGVQGARVRPLTARGAPHEIGVIATDALVQLYELFGIDHAGLQRFQPVLQTYVVVRNVRLGDSIDVDKGSDDPDVVVGTIAADAVRVARAVHQRVVGGEVAVRGARRIERW